uniref:Uncharacterized protein n=1 Tax=Nelumbo nucifera TaxID=4432 RepID=A0A822XDA1_NELNU|nr:TPA_asm: hypothetical protein HUJ06_019325 [Nelumbo nucifera]
MYGVRWILGTLEAQGGGGWQAVFGRATCELRVLVLVSLRTPKLEGFLRKGEGSDMGDGGNMARNRGRVLFIVPPNIRSSIRQSFQQSLAARWPGKRRSVRFHAGFPRSDLFTNITDLIVLVSTPLPSKTKEQHFPEYYNDSEE